MINQRNILSVSQITRFALVLAIGIAAAATARAEEATYAQRVACTPDAFRLCSDQIPDVAAVKSCMIANKAKLSAACRATFPKETAAR
ncbi:hypothetical protein [Methyloferula stellata]|jgi:hypothetical protein|uniref:hypothetical protein n=1 Tax=Methyloferula stellata TaxID=876270 RepID=UPI00037B0D74|nr:hypothetical protein [Methyloferula stellata]